MIVTWILKENFSLVSMIQLIQLIPINSAISISSDHDTSLAPINSISSKYM